MHRYLQSMTLLLIQMQEGSIFFGQSFYNLNFASTPVVEQEEYCPWSQEVQNYKKQLVKKGRNKEGQSHRRYTSQKDHSKGHTEDHQNRNSLPFHPITISYDAKLKKIIESGENKREKIKLPALTGRRRSLLIGGILETEKEGQWGVLGENKRSSLKRYTPHWRYQEHTPSFQIYKRSLIAARRLVAASNPQGAFQSLLNL